MKTLTRVFLTVSGLGWALYGLYCLFAPEQLGPIAGVVASAPSGTTELRAMYGGVQTAVGIAVLIGVFKAGRVVWSLQVQAVMFVGLFPARALSALLAGDASAYTVGALCFEAVFLALTLLLLRQRHAL